MSHIVRMAMAIGFISLICSSILLNATSVKAQVEVLNMTRAEAERDALRNSDILKSYVETTHAAQEQTDAQYAQLFPRLTLDAYYTYFSYVPKIQFTGNSIDFGAHNNYSYGPTLTYTLWDTFATLKSYRSAKRVTESKDEDRRSEELQLLLGARSDYVRVQESLEEMRAVQDSVKLARAQNAYIVKRYKAGGSTYLDHVESERAILSYQIQLAQKQAELSSAIKDLLARTRDRVIPDLSLPGPRGLPGITLEVNFETLQESLSQAQKIRIVPPDDSHPSLKALELTAEASDLQAESIHATLYPVFQLKGGVYFQYQTVPVSEPVNQNQVTVSGSVPIFEMNRTRHLSEEKRMEADSTRYRKSQSRINLMRDFDKGREVLASLLKQQALATDNVLKSIEAARLYYDQYKGGKANLIDVQSANNRALISKVTQARIDAQILNQIDQLRALSGKESHE